MILLFVLFIVLVDRQLELLGDCVCLHGFEVPLNETNIWVEQLMIS